MRTDCDIMFFQQNRCIGSMFLQNLFHSNRIRLVVRWYRRFHCDYRIILRCLREYCIRPGFDHHRLHLWHHH